MRGTRLDELLAVVAFLALPLGSCATKADAAPESQGTNGGSGAGSTAPSAAPTTGSSAASSTPTPGDSRATGNGGALSALIASASATAMAAGATGTVPASASAMRDVLLVGNSVAGTVSVIDARTYENMGAVNVLPDKDEVLGAINADLVRAIAYPLVKNAQLLHHFEPAGGDRFVDDEFLSPDGTVLYVSRSNLGDVAAFDLSRPGHPRLWRTFVDSPKADHATISPDGSRLVVSATGTSRVADVIDTKTGKIVGTFPTGYYPHQNDYSHDGKFIYNSSIGNVGYNAVTYANNMQKGDRWLVKVDATTLATVDKWVFDFGIRPNVLSADEKILYTQLSYLNGVIKYDMVGRKEIARSDQPLSQFALSTYATYDEYPHDSAHHGLALSGDGERLCDCGTIDNTVQIVSTATMAVEKTVDVGMVPDWATTGPDGRECFVSLSGDNAVAVIDYETGTLSRTIPVEAFPQRSRLAKMPESIVRALSSKASADAGTGTKGPACNPGDLLNLLAPADAGGPAVVSCLLTTCLLDVIGQVGQCMSRCLQAETSIAPACGDCLGRELQGARDTCLTQCGDDFECYGDCALTALGTAGKACLL